MKSTLNLFALIIIVFIGSSFTIVDSNISAWTKLGSKQVSYKLDKDVLRVGAKNGGLKKLKLVVTGGNLNMHKMVVEYGNGTKEKISIKHNFSKGSDTRIIDLDGGKRIIKDISFWYDTKNFSKKRAVVHVFGRS